jgi:hypothetical protein
MELKMAPFDAGYIQDGALKTAPSLDRPVRSRSQADVAGFDAALVGLPVDRAELEEALTAPALRKQTGIEGFLQVIDANGALTGLVFICVYLALISAT